MDKKFLYGVATSAAQIEGAAFEDGREGSIWDTFAQKKGKIQDKSLPSPGCNHYHLWEKDIEWLSWLGVDVYRFSLSWSRILPKGVGKVNVRGIAFYQKLLESLKKKNIRPYVTLYHWDLPQALQEKGGWTNRDIRNWFCEYVAVVDEYLGRYVDSYIILNEPFIFTVLGYFLGIHAPGLRGRKNFFQAMHYALLAQGEAARLLRKRNHRVRLGTSLSTVMAYPKTNKPKDILAAKRFFALFNELFLHPVLGLSYPFGDLPFLKGAKKYIEEADLEKIAFPFDFWGVNFYTTKLIEYSAVIPFLHFREISRPLPVTEMGWEVEPRGIYDILVKFSQYPAIKEIVVTENGAAFYDEVINGKVYDYRRIQYLKDHIEKVHQARKSGVNVTGYFVWSLLDNFEWAYGYRPRFGLLYVDYKTQERIPKESAYWYKNFIQQAKSHHRKVNR